MSATKVFPYPYTIDDLANGLRLVTVRTDYPNLVALYIVVQAGSRNEVEAGRSGFAHLFEHLMFRGSENYTTAQYEEILKDIGADRNAYTTDDRTVYHTVFDREDLDTVMELEADRFQRLKVPEDLFKTETKAVLGEYNKNASNPINRLIEVLRDTAFERHPYKHTTMGFLRDVQAMPGMYDYSLEFFRRYYRPEYTTLVLVGDVDRDRALGVVEKYWGDWPRGDYVPEIPAEPEQTAERTAHVEWPSPTLPWVAVAYKGPVYSDERKDMAAMDLIGNLGFSSNSELYQRLVIREQKVDAFFFSFEDKLDPYLLIVLARVKRAGDVAYVRNEIIAAFERFQRERVADEKLTAVKSNLKYGFALRMDHSEAIAGTLASYIALRRTPETIDRLYQVYDAITPGDLVEMARRYFVPEHRTVVTLASEEESV